MDSRLYWIWLQQVLPAGSRAVSELLDVFGHARPAQGQTLRHMGDSQQIHLGQFSQQTAYRFQSQTIGIVFEHGDQSGAGGQSGQNGLGVAANLTQIHLKI